MENKPRAKMPVSERAKQFSPFAAVRGLEEALEKKRREILFEEKRVLSEDAVAAINNTLANLLPGDTVFVTYYDTGIYKSVRQSVLRVDGKNKTLYTDGEEISFFDISKITPVDR